MAEVDWDSDLLSFSCLVCTETGRSFYENRRQRRIMRMRRFGVLVVRKRSVEVLTVRREGSVIKKDEFGC